MKDVFIGHRIKLIRTVKNQFGCRAWVLGKLYIQYSKELIVIDRAIQRGLLQGRLFGRDYRQI